MITFRTLPFGYFCNEYLFVMYTLYLDALSKANTYQQLENYFRNLNDATQATITQHFKTFELN